MPRPACWTGVIACILLSLQTDAADVDLTKLPPAAGLEVDYARDVRPIFDAACFRCHGPEKPKSGFRLDNRESALKGGDLNEGNIVPGDGSNSPLIHYVAGLVEDLEMPPAGKGEPLTAEQVGILRAWIDQGARWSEDAMTGARPPSVSITPMVGWVSVSGNARKFNQDTGLKEGLLGGFEHFELRDPTPGGGEFRAEGRALFDQHDYGVSLSLTRPGLGFVRGGYDAYRKYYNDVGGYYAPFGLPPPRLDQDLYVDREKAWFEVGFARPGLPVFVIGYEYHSRAGEESTLNWGQYPSDPFESPRKAILPSSRRIDEVTHVIRLDASHEIGGTRFEDNFRVEFYELRDTPMDYEINAADGRTRTDQSQTQFQASNALRIEKSLRKWLFLSGGYLYTHVDADASFSRMFDLIPFFPTDPTITLIEQSTGISLSQDSHTVNANALLGPWQGLSFSVGLQADWLSREGLANLLTGSSTPAGTNLFPNTGISNLDKTSFRQEAGLRYTSIPYTVLYATAGLAQESYDLYEDDRVDAAGQFLRDTDVQVLLQTYRAGVSFSPWQPVSLTASYKYQDKRNDYDTVRGSTGPAGYPGYLRVLDVAGDEVEVKLAMRINAWLRATLKYQWIATDYRNRVNSPSLGGEFLSGSYDADVYGIQFTLTPWRRLYLSAQFSYSDTRTISGVNNGGSVAPYRGDGYSVLLNGTLALDNVSDLNVTYAYGRADYGQDNLPDGLPLGTTFERHTLTAGLKRQLTKSLTGSLRYALFQYDEPTSAGANDYTAHAVFASLTVKIP